MSELSFTETLSEAVKILKGDYVIQAIEEHKMDRSLIFCRTKLDCDNLEKYLLQRGQGKMISSVLYYQLSKNNSDWAIKFTVIEFKTSDFATCKLRISEPGICFMNFPCQLQLSDSYGDNYVSNAFLFLRFG